MKPTRYFALGGMMEIGKSTHVIEHDQDIVIIDAGIKFANSIDTGVDGIIPNYAYLKENEDRIRGLFITHGHEDHIGGVPYLLKHVQVPKVVAARIAIEFIKAKLKEKKIVYNGEFIEIDKDDVHEFNTLKVDFWTAQHSIPDAFGIRVTSPNGSIANTGDFRFDYSPIGNLTDFTKMEQIGEEGLDVLMSDSTNALSPDHSPTEMIMMRDIENVIENHDGKVVLTTFASNMHRVHAVVKLAAKHGRKVCVFGRSMVKGMDIARKLNMVDVPDSTFVDKRDLSKLEDKKVLIICTGSQGEERAFLSRLAYGKQDWVKLTRKDVVLFSASPIPGNRMQIEELVNQLYKVGVQVLEHRVDGHFHTSGHAYKVEHEKIFEVMKPKYFVPVHGSYTQSAVHGYTAHESGVKKENVLLGDLGVVFELKDHVLTMTDEVIDAGPIYIDSGVATVKTNDIIKKRAELGESGFINIVATIDKNKNEIVGRTRVISRGAMFVKTSADVISEIQKMAHGTILYIIKNNSQWTKAQIKKKLEDRIKPYFHKMKRRNVVIISSIIDYNRQPLTEADFRKNKKNAQKPKQNNNAKGNNANSNKPKNNNQGQKPKQNNKAKQNNNTKSNANGNKPKNNNQRKNNKPKQNNNKPKQNNNAKTKQNNKPKTEKNDQN